MTRLTLSEREIVISQSAQDRRDGIWHVWSNDRYHQRRLEKRGAKLIEETGGGGRQYEVGQRQILIRATPARRVGPRTIHFQRSIQDVSNQVQEVSPLATEDLSRPA